MQKSIIQRAIHCFTAFVLLYLLSVKSYRTIPADNSYTVCRNPLDSVVTDFH